MTRPARENTTDPVRLQQRAGLAACGPTLQVFAGQVLASRATLARLGQQLAELLCSHHPVALRVCDTGQGHDVIARLRRLCHELARGVDSFGADAGLLELTLDVSSVPPLAAWNIRRNALGSGPLNIVLDSTAMQKAVRAGCTVSDRTWQQLWQLRREPVFSAFWPTVSSACPLLCAEPAADVIPALGLQSPGQAAFLHRALDLSRYIGDRNAIDLRGLEETVAMTIDEAELLHDVTVWPTPAMQQDAWFNRRIAIRVTGIGDAVRARGLDPESHATLRELNTLLSRIRHYAEKHSRRIAKFCEPLPAIAATDPCAHFAAPTLRDEWQQRWQRAVERSGLRHRNLIVISPWSVFPRTSADYRYANLLPLLTHADACEFRSRRRLCDWSAARFVDFHKRVWAVRRRKCAAMVIADQP